MQNTVVIIAIMPLNCREKLVEIKFMSNELILFALGLRSDFKFLPKLFPHR